MSSTINELKLVRRLQRKARVAGAVRGSTERPRLSIFRSVKHIYAQIVDDTTGNTLVAVNSDQKEASLKHGGNKNAATAIGKLIAGKAIAKGITMVAFGAWLREQDQAAADLPPAELVGVLDSASLCAQALTPTDVRALQSTLVAYADRQEAQAADQT